MIKTLAMLTALLAILATAVLLDSWTDATQPEVTTEEANNLLTGSAVKAVEKNKETEENTTKKEKPEQKEQPQESSPAAGANLNIKITIVDDEKAQRS